VTPKPKKRKRTTLAQRRKSYVPSPAKSRKLRQIRGWVIADDAEKQRRLERAAAVATIESLIAADDVPALASPQNFAAAVRYLIGKLPDAQGVVAALYAADAVTPWRLANAFGIVSKRWQIWTPAKVLRLIRDAQGPAADTIRALLTGSGEPAAAVMLRRVIEARRGAALPVFAIGEGEQ